MRRIWRVARIALCLSGIGVALSAPVAAQPSDNPCTLAASFLCRFVPIAPDLDGDVDLTKDQPAAALAPESAPPADPCVTGCI